MNWISNIKISFCNAGLISVWDERWALHLIVFPYYWVFGKAGGKHKAFGRVNVYGCGPLFLLTINPK